MASFVPVVAPLACFLFLQLWSTGVSAAHLSCTENTLHGCIGRFKTYLESGVEIFKDSNETFVAKVCGTYSLTSDCLSMLMYYCPEFKKLKDKVKQFEYACNAEDRTGSWPYMPTFSPEESDRIDEELAEKERENMIDNAIKAGAAAGVTVFLISICISADCISKCKVRRRIKKAAAAAVAAAASNQGDQPLLKNADGEETTDTEVLVKKP